MILKCKCGYQWNDADDYIRKYGDAGKVCPDCGEIGIESKAEEPEFYDI